MGKGTKVGERAELSKCVTQCGYEVGASGMSVYIFCAISPFIRSTDTARNEKLDVSDWTAAQTSEDDDEDEESGEDESAESDD